MRSPLDEEIDYWSSRLKPRMYEHWSVQQPSPIRKNLHSSKTNEWYTPPWVMEKVRALIGDIELDPASSERANEIVRAKRYYTKNRKLNPVDPLDMKIWKADTVWLNPPYGRDTGKWVNKLVGEWSVRSVKKACLLVNAVPDRRWFLPLWDFPMVFFYKRIRFLNSKGEEQSNPTNGNVLVYLYDAFADDPFNPEGWEDPLKKLKYVFDNVGKVVWAGR